MSTRLLEKGGFMLSEEGFNNLCKAINSDDNKNIRKIKIADIDYGTEDGLNQFAKRILTSCRKKGEKF